MAYNAELFGNFLNFELERKGYFKKRIGTFISGCLSNLVPKGHDPFAHGLWGRICSFWRELRACSAFGRCRLGFFPPFSPNLSHVSSHFPLFTWFCFSLLIVLFCPADWLSVHFMFTLTTVVGKPLRIVERPCNIRPFVSISLLVKGDSMQRTCGSKGERWKYLID